MKRLALLPAALALALGTTAAAGALNLDGQAILEAVDGAVNFGSQDLSAVMSMIKEDPVDGIDKRVVQQFRRDRDDKFVFLFLEPAVQKGQGYLRIDESLWFYDPESRKFTHTSMKERFGGTHARNSDFGLSSLREDYRAVSAEEGVLGKYQVYVLDLEARNNEVTYARRRLWVTRDTHLVLKSEDSSETGRLLRTSLFPSYTRAGGSYVPSRMIFVDELVKGARTTISLSEISLAPLPDSVFTKSYIERVNR
jgi:outer membrane lipoprotein-sorting protein